MLSTEIFFAIVGAQFDQGRGGARHRSILLGFTLAAFALQHSAGQHPASYHAHRQGRRRRAGCPAGTPCGGHRRGALGPARVHGVVYRSRSPAASCAPGAATTRRRSRTWSTAFDAGATARPGAGSRRGTRFHHLKLAGIAAPLTAHRPADRLAAGAHASWPGRVEFGALLLRHPRHRARRGYILAFNVPPFELTGTGLIIVLCFVFRNLPVGVRRHVAAFGRSTSRSTRPRRCRASTATTCAASVLPLLKPALVAALVYSFVRSMTTVSAVIFLVTAENELATTYIIGRVGNGDYGVALACLLHGADDPDERRHRADPAPGRRTPPRTPAPHALPAHAATRGPIPCKQASAAPASVVKRYGRASAPLVVKGLDLAVPAGQLTTLLGPSGCGRPPCCA